MVSIRVEVVTIRPNPARGLWLLDDPNGFAAELGLFKIHEF
jgi:hypothetical protein